MATTRIIFHSSSIGGNGKSSSDAAIGEFSIS